MPRKAGVPNKITSLIKERLADIISEAIDSIDIKTMTKAEFPKPKAKMLYNVFLNLCTKKWGVSKKYEIKDGFSGYDCTLTIPNNY